MFLPTPAESQREWASTVCIAGMNHRCATSAEAHGSRLTALSFFNVGAECAVG
jgi:hypothetical protein